VIGKIDVFASSVNPIKTPTVYRYFALLRVSDASSNRTITDAVISPTAMSDRNS
jgi:hypothetical protein